MTSVSALRMRAAMLLVVCRDRDRSDDVSPKPAADPPRVVLDIFLADG
jgi:hypothetical protein